MRSKEIIWISFKSQIVFSFSFCGFPSIPQTFYIYSMKSDVTVPGAVYPLTRALASITSSSSRVLVFFSRDFDETRLDRDFRPQRIETMAKVSHLATNARWLRCHNANENKHSTIIQRPLTHLLTNWLKQQQQRRVFNEGFPNWRHFEWRHSVELQRHHIYAQCACRCMHSASIAPF